MTPLKDSMFRSAPAVIATLSVMLLGAGAAHADTLYITTAGNSTITTYDTAGGGTGIFASGGSLAAPQQLAFDGHGVLYVANPNGDSVLEYSGPGSVTTVKSSKSFTPSSLAVAASGRAVYAGDYYSGIVYSYDPADASPTPTSFVTGLSGPGALALGTEGALAGDLFVANTNGSDILVYSPSRDLVATFTGFSKPEGLAFDAAGDLYVTDDGSDTIEEFAAAALTNGSSILKAAATLTLSPTSDPRGLAFGSDGNLYVAEYGSGVVAEVNPTLTQTPASLISGLQQPAFIAVSAPSVAVPEPSTTWAIWIAGGAGLGGGVLRQRRRQA